MVANGACILFFFLTFSTKTIENLLRTGRTSEVYVGEAMRDNPSPRTRKFPDLNSNSQELSNRVARKRSVLSEEPLNDLTAGDRSAMRDLTTALEDAAQVHAQCAEANR